MNTLIPIYLATLAPAALIGLFVGVYLYTLPDDEAEAFSVDDYTASVPPEPVERRRLARPVPAPAPAVPAVAPGYLGGAPIYYRLVAAQVLRQAAQREAVTR